MAKRIEVPGQGIVEFPDSMSDEQIVSAIQRISTPSPAAPATPVRSEPSSMAGMLPAGAEVGPNAPPQAAQPMGGAAQAATNRLRYINDVLSFGAYDKLIGAARAAAGGPSYQQASQEEAAKTQAAKSGLSTAEQVGYGVIGAAPLAAAGGVVGIMGRGLSGLGAQSAGSALSRAASTAAPTLAQRAGVGAVEVGAQGAAEAAIRGQDISKGAATGAGIGAAIPVALSGAGRFISPIARQLTPPQIKLAEEARARGLELTPGQATGSRATQFLESQLRDLPGGGQSPRIQQQEQLQKLVLKEAGIDAPFATPEAITSGFQNVGQRFESVLAGRKIELGDKFGEDIVETLKKYTNRLDTNVKPIFRAQAEGLLSEGRVIDGVRANVLRSDIAGLERSYKNDPELRRALGGLRRAVDSAIDKSIPSSVAPELRRAREQYKNLSRINEVMSKAGPQSESGNIPFVQLNNLIKQRQGTVSRGISAASPEMSTLSQIGSQFFREPPSSGTSQRNYINALLTGAVGAGSFAAGGLPAVAAALATPYATNVLYNTPLARQFLKQQAGRRLDQVPQQFSAGGGQTALGLLGE